MRKKKEEQGKQRQQLQLQQRIQITKLLQRNSTSIGTLKTLAIKETRHEENRLAIPEGDEDEDNNDDENESDSNKTKKEGQTDGRKRTTTIRSYEECRCGNE